MPYTQPCFYWYEESALTRDDVDNKKRNASHEQIQSQ